MKRPNLLSLLLRLVVLGLATLATHVLFTASMSQETRLGASHTPSSGKLVKSSWIRETRKKQSQMLLSCSHLDVPSVAQVTDWLHLTGPQGNVTLNDKSAYFYLPSIPKSPAATVFCGYVLVSLSGKYREPRPHFHPIPGFPPDSVEINAVGLKSTTFGRMGREPLLSTTVENVLVRVYAASVDLRDAGEYTISGTLEYVNYEWNYEKHQDISWDPVPLKFLVAKENEKAASLDITVSSGFDLTAKSYAKLPFCIGGDHPGRWINVTDGILPPNDPHGDSLTHYKDEEGRIWLPYNCRYRPLSYSYFSRCLAKHHPSLHIWADSHMRRSLKAISTGGAWCNTWYDPDSSECKCYDWNLQVPFMNMSNVVDFFPQIGGNNGAKVFYYTWQGLLPWGPNWRADMERPQLEALTAPLSEKTGLDMSQPSVLILSMTNWDAAYGTYAMAEKAIGELVDRIKRTYPGVSIIWRPGQYFCCRADFGSHGDGKRRFSRLRVEAMDELFGSALIREFRAQVWDVYTLGESQAPSGKERIAKCASNHMTRVGVDLENQILMNMLCPVE